MCYIKKWWQIFQERMTLVFQSILESHLSENREALERDLQRKCKKKEEEEEENK